MGKIIDITEKLSFDSNPRIRIRDVELEVNADAKTVLSIMGKLGDRPTNRNVLQCLELLFSAPEREKLDALNLSFPDYMNVVEQAMDLASGAGVEDSQGEGETRTTT